MICDERTTKGAAASTALQIGQLEVLNKAQHTGREPSQPYRGVWYMIAYSQPKPAPHIDSLGHSTVQCSAAGAEQPLQLIWQAQQHILPLTPYHCNHLQNEVHQVNKPALLLSPW